MSTLTFCPPPQQPSKTLLSSSAHSPMPTPTLAGVVVPKQQQQQPSRPHPLSVTTLPLPTTLPPPPSAAASSAANATAVPTQPPTLPQPAPPALKRKRVVHPVDGSQPKRRKAVPTTKPSALPRLPSPSSRSHSPTATVRPGEDHSESDDQDIDFSIFAPTRRSTPVIRGDSVTGFGSREECTLHREIRTETRRQQLRCGIVEDGRIPDLVTNETVVKPIIERYYRTYFSNPEDPNDTTFNAHPTNYPVVELEYPNHAASERYILLVPADKDHYNPIMELMNAVHTIIGFYLLPHEQTPFGTLPAHLAIKAVAMPPTVTPTTESPPPPPPFAHDHLRNLEKAYHTRNGPLFVSTVHEINRLLRPLKDRMMQNVQYGWDGVPPAVWKAVVEECYQRCVGPNIKDLGKYTPFSNEVYGELNASFVSDIVFRTNLRANNTFVDLGCGVGNCLIQAALQVGCTANGIEINPPPAALGALQVAQFRKRLRLWGLSAGNVALRRGDFCEDVNVREWIAKADVVLVNNWAFSAQLNEKLSLMFLDLPEGAQIVSLKPFRRPDFRLTDRTASSPQAIFRVEEIEFRRGAVSWMAEGGVYYLHTVDREPLRLFIEKTDRQRQQQAATRAAGGGRRKRVATSSAAVTAAAAVASSSALDVD